MTRRGVIAFALLAGLTLAHFDFGVADAWSPLGGLPGGLVWHGAFCLLATAVYAWLVGGTGETKADPE